MLAELPRRQALGKALYPRSVSSRRERGDEEIHLGSVLPPVEAEASGWVAFASGAVVH